MDNSPSTTTQTTKSEPWAPAQPALSSILAKAQTLGGNTSLFTPTTTNSTPVLQQTVQNASNPTQAATTINPLLAQTNANYTTGASTLGNLATGGATDVNMNPYLEDALKPANQMTADAVNAQFSAAGRYGSGAQTTALTNAIANQNNTALSNQFNTQQSNAANAAATLANNGISAAGLAPSVDTANNQKNLLGIEAGQQLDANAQAEKQAPLAALGYEQGVVQPIAGLGSSGTSSGTSVQGSNPLTTGLGLGLAGLSLFSDERVKENIREVGKTHDGQKIYSYNYKGNPTPTLGLLAQDVEKEHPEAVGNVGGVKTVNYRQATKGAAKGKVRNPSALGMLAS
jgi:hypothetical protein